MASGMATPMANGRRYREDAKALSPMMVSILALHASGRTHSEIAQTLFISYSTVVALVSQAKDRLDARNLAGCVLKAHMLGYITYPDGGVVYPTLMEFTETTQEV